MVDQVLGRIAVVARGVYDPQSEYERLDAVTYNGSSYLVRKHCRGVTPEVGEYYMLMAQSGDSTALNAAVAEALRAAGDADRAAAEANDAAVRVEPEITQLREDLEGYTNTVAGPETLGGVMPVAKTEKMTTLVGVDETGRLFADASENPFATIADVTLTEAASVISITEDMYGKPFALREIVAKITFPATESAKTISVYFGIEVNPAKGFARIQNLTHVTYGTESRCYAVIKHGRIMNISSVTSTTQNYYQSEKAEQILQGIGMLEAEKFDKLCVFTYTDGGFPAGSRVVIEGVPM